VSTPSSTFTIEVYRGGAGEGELRTFLGSTTVNTNAVCAGPWSLTVPVAVTVGSEITAIAIDSAGNTSEVSDPVVVTPAPLQVAKAFLPTEVGRNVESRVTITITNPGSTAATNLSFTDTFPAGLVPSGTPDVANTCGGTATPGANSITLSGGTLAGASSCSVSLDVVSALPGTYLNSINLGDVTSSTVPANTTNTNATLTVLSPLQAVKTFVPDTIAAGGTTTLRVTLTNSANASTAITGVAFTDTYPAGLVNAAPVVTNTTCGGTVTAIAGAGSFSFAGGTIPAAGMCVVEINVTAAASGSYLNDIPAGAVTSTNAGPTDTATSDTLEVSGPLTINKSFATDPIGPGGTSVLTVTLANPNAFAVTGTAFTDSYPVAITNAAAPNASTTCGGSVTAVAGGSSVALSGGTVAASSNCTVTVTVTSSTAGTHTNTIPTGAVTTNNAGSSTAPASDTLTVNAPPAIAKSFTPVTIAPAGTSTLTITLSNSNSVPLTGVAFTDAYPAAIANAATPNASTTCGGTVTAAAGGGSVALSGGAIPASGSCTVTVNVTTNTVGSHGNTIPAGGVTTINGGSNTAPASATLNVTALVPPSVAKSFSPDAITTGQTSTLTITLSNTNGQTLTGVVFTDNYPAAITNAAAPNASTTCGGIVTAAAGGGSVALSGGSIPASGSCTVTVTVTSNTAGSHGNTIPAGGVATTNGGSNTAPAAATLNVTALVPPGVTKSFAPSAITAGQTSTLTITLSNTNGQTLTGVVLTDNYPAAITNAAAPNASTTCGGTVTAAAGGGSVALSGGAIPASGSCTVTVNVTSATAGAHANTIPAGGLSTTEGGANTSPATATLTVSALAPPTARKSFNPATVAPGQSSTLTITLTNGNAAAITGVAFTDNYPAGITNAAPPNASSTCGGVVTALAGGSSLALSGATIPASGNCTVSVSVLLAPGTPSAVNTIPVGGITSANAPPSGASATATLAAAAAGIPTLSTYALLILALAIGIGAVFTLRH
jgi:uncharacterized repeat protein (TIGR01451 family)